MNPQKQADLRFVIGVLLAVTVLAAFIVCLRLFAS